ncbi:OmpA/MotB domain protein [Dinoroseobacter shibae DFL 12 = DSM 16493]|jgi:outer membrane protein OmpA-like peptidoglycan-associated protein|uniref:OmpA/MotB domain protein n=1 Tax=Dinoroseobacter shibae (strain DSM 16493 / NCIMB 14021 / DFL 12) TaxID=398580 RepID=A8LHS3_DINSH|nr:MULTISPECIES: OmpA family protein [Dinoroseobacter]ABV92870.1 OmpA/MotB domain protein [Dinoroseobacter shibae DFL 12 = DSM 16493]MDD9715970.1 OmpA family protein [Dinoroseobacter sp. PD6]URF47806.1 OmpA family protein [Dinoroseobacter shibae]URF52116.1 OmpA family protein [Dinoroseobacter shibae]
MRRTSSAFIALTLTAALGACAYSEIGSEVDEGGFGDATMNNTLVQTGELSASISLAQRFAREVPSTVNFAFNQSTLTSEARAALDVQADFIKQFPELRFSVFGHTDLVGSAAYNRRLGQARATTVVNYLVSRGVQPEQLQALVSLGETQPLVVTQDREMRNRRTVTEVSGFLENDPIHLDGKYAAVVNREFVEGATYERRIMETETGNATEE